MYCPGCEPEADPTREILDVRWCESHSPVRGGLDDDNRRWCELFHRRN
jgi:hypothetical protein